MPGSSAIYMRLFYCGSSYYINPYELSTKPNVPFQKLSFNDIYSSEKACLIKRDLAQGEENTTSPMHPFDIIVLPANQKQNRSQTCYNGTCLKQA